MSSLVSYALQDGVATITMDDGKANALSPALQAELNAAIDQAAADKAVILLSGRAGVFSAGFDLKTLTAGGPPAVQMLSGGFELAERLLNHPRPIVAACQGHALAMGLFLLLTADYIVAAEGNFKFGANEVAIGLTVPHTALEILRARLQPAAFIRAAQTSEIFTPASAQVAGIVDALVPADAVLDQARARAQAFVTLNAAAYKNTKALVRAPLMAAIRNALEADKAIFRMLAKMS